MIEAEIHYSLTLFQFALGVLTIIGLWAYGQGAPYGRYVRGGWGPTLPAPVIWAIMETPPVLLFIAIFFAGQHSLETVPLVFLGMWQFHYIHRAYIFPFRLRSKGQPKPISIGLMAIAFNSLNAYINARWIGHFGEYDLSWLTDPRFVIGAAMFVTGFSINYWADRTLITLRKPGETGYEIPRGGLFKYISCPNYFGEILEWTGFAIATWSLPGAAFAFYTAANIGPRAFTHHAWYKEKFPDYPKDRKALIPFVA